MWGMTVDCTQIISYAQGTYYVSIHDINVDRQGRCPYCKGTETNAQTNEQMNVEMNVEMVEAA